VRDDKSHETGTDHGKALEQLEISAAVLATQEDADHITDTDLAQEIGQKHRVSVSDDPPSASIEHPPKDLKKDRPKKQQMQDKDRAGDPDQDASGGHPPKAVKKDIPKKKRLHHKDKDGNLNESKMPLGDNKHNNYVVVNIAVEGAAGPPAKHQNKRAKKN